MNCKMITPGCTQALKTYYMGCLVAHLVEQVPPCIKGSVFAVKAQGSIPPCTPLLHAILPLSPTFSLTIIEAQKAPKVIFLKKSYLRKS